MAWVQNPAEKERPKEEELEDLEKAIKLAKENYNIDGVVSGALFSTYQRDRIEKICDKLGLKIFSPLWHKPQDKHMREVIDHGFEVILTKIAADGLDKNWLNQKINLKLLDKLKNLQKKLGTNLAGEGGEFESLVLDGPLFKKKIVLEEIEVIEEDKYTSYLNIKRAKLVDKQ